VKVFLGRDYESPGQNLTSNRLLTLNGAAQEQPAGPACVN
jgi:hypothetical protein